MISHYSKTWIYDKNIFRVYENIQSRLDKLSNWSYFRGGLSTNNDIILKKHCFQLSKGNKMGIGEWFSDFCSALIIRDTTVALRYKRITKRLNIEYYNSESETDHSIYVGSYGRNTAINSTSDFDILFQLPFDVYKRFSQYASNGQSALLQDVKEKIEKTYRFTNIKADGQVIVIPFDDGITFELLPAFLNKDNSFTYPNANNGGSWKTTDPKSEQEAMAAMNQATNGNLIRLCRMVRAWKNKNNVTIDGILIDTLAYNFISQWEYNKESYLYYDWMSRDFFQYLSNIDSNRSYWYAPGSNRCVYNSGYFQYKAKQAYNTALKAIEYADSKCEYSAKLEWRDIYGTDFPA